MRLIPFAVAVGMLTAGQPAAAQQRDGNGGVAISTRTAQPVRIAYRAGIDVLMRAGYSIARMSLDNALFTGDTGLDGRPAGSAVRMVFTARGDSTTSTSRRSSRIRRGGASAGPTNASGR